MIAISINVVNPRINHPSSQPFGRHFTSSHFLEVQYTQYETSIGDGLPLVLHGFTTLLRPALKLVEMDKSLRTTAAGLKTAVQLFWWICGVESSGGSRGMRMEKTWTKPPFETW